MSDSSKVIIAALAGAAVGAVAALLLAPKSGKETRAELKDKLAAAKDKVSDFLNKEKSALDGAAKKAKEEAV